MFSKITSYFFVALFFVIVSFQCLTAQNFKNEKIVDISGENIDFDVTKSEAFLYGDVNAETYLCWVNSKDQNYSIYLKQISPIIGENLIVVSDSNIKSNPKIIKDSQLILGWQSFDGNFWNIDIVKIGDDKKIIPILKIDSLTSNPQFDLSTEFAVWIENGKLVLKKHSPNIGDKIALDSVNCSNPNLTKATVNDFPYILYQKNNTSKNQIILLKHNRYPIAQWETEIVASGNVLNPKFGGLSEIFYEEIKDSITIIKSYFENFYTKNTNCNYKNADIFTYPIPTGDSAPKFTPYFFVFESDSIIGNVEVEFQPFLPEGNVKNVSNSIYEDSHPKVGLIFENDSLYVSIFYLRKEYNKHDIWVAKSVFHPIISDVEIKNIPELKFELSQNHPNPFNPTTTITYSIPVNENRETKNVKLTVYDVLGNEVATLVNEKKPAGNYEVKFDGSRLSSGIYFYQLKSGNFSETKKMMLIK